jgi:hypothetical protein
MLIGGVPWRRVALYKYIDLNVYTIPWFSGILRLRRTCGNGHMAADNIITDEPRAHTIVYSVVTVKGSL